MEQYQSDPTLTDKNLKKHIIPQESKGLSTTEQRQEQTTIKRDVQVHTIVSSQKRQLRHQLLSLTYQVSTARSAQQTSAHSTISGNEVQINKKALQLISQPNHDANKQILQQEVQSSSKNQSITIVNAIINEKYNEQHQKEENMHNLSAHQIERKSSKSKFAQNQQEHNQKIVTRLNLSPKIEESKSYTQTLLERKLRLEDRYNKSQKIRANIIKLEPIASKRESELRATLNKLRMTQTIEFLQKQGAQDTSTKQPATQWRQQKQSKQKRIQDLIEKTSPPRKKSPEIIKFTGISPNKSKRSPNTSNQKQARSLPRLEKQIILEKPMPYSIYNLYQRKTETIKLSSLANS